MKKLTLALLASALLVVFGTSNSVRAETPTPSPSPMQDWVPDESKPIMSYCQKDLYACDGYVAASDEQYLPPWVPGFKNYQGYYHNDLAGLYRMTSYAIAITRDGSGNATSVVACSDITASNCTGTRIMVRAVMPPCSDAVTIDCFKDFVVKDADGKNLDYTVEGPFPVGNPQYFTGSQALRVPNGGAPTIIHIPGAPHKGGDAYLVKPEMDLMKDSAIPEFNVRSFQVSITAVKLINGKYSFGKVSTNPALFSGGFDENGDEEGGTPSYCAASSPTQCAAKYSLPLGIKLGLTVNLSRKITGWLHGRVKGPEVDVSTNSAGGNTVKILAEPIKIPVNAAWVNNDVAPQSIKDFYNGKPNYGSSLWGPLSKYKPLSEIDLMRDANMGHNSDTLNEYLSWLTTLGDKAQAMPTAWTVQTMSNYQVSDQIQKCLNQTDSLAGIVTTNAAEYLDGPPVFDKASGSLDYKVAATHFEPDGTTVFRGTYDLVMSSKVARCIYGFTNAPVSATVSVTSDSGGSNIATTIVNERAGWLSLGAYNFTYSNPTIHVKLTGTLDQPVVPKVVAKKITCVKGKVSKVVTTASCPTGFKKKI